MTDYSCIKGLEKEINKGKTKHAALNDYEGAGSTKGKGKPKKEKKASKGSK